MSKKKRITLGVGYPTFSGGRVGMRQNVYEFPEFENFDWKQFWCYCPISCKCKKWKLILERVDDKKS